MFAPDPISRIPNFWYITWYANLRAVPKGNQGSHWVGQFTFSLFIYLFIFIFIFSSRPHNFITIRRNYGTWSTHRVQHTIIYQMNCTEYNTRRHFSKQIPLSPTFESVIRPVGLLLHAHQAQANHHGPKISSPMESMRQQCHWPRHQRQPTFSSRCAYDDAFLSLTIA